MITLPRTGQRKVGSAPVASLALAGVSAAGASSALVVAWASRALCGGTPVSAASLVAGATDPAATAAGCASGAAAAVFEPGPGTFLPGFGLAGASGPLGLAGWG